jgi:tetraacyldisaccharide 4'-kinase
VEAVRALLDAHPETQVILCDDGLQHLALGRAIEVVVFDNRGAGNGWRLPLGPLREPLSRLKPVDALVFNGNVQAEISMVAADLPVFQMTLHPGTFYRLGHPAEHCTAEDLRRSDKPLHALAGIGHPSRFFTTLKNLGLFCTEHPFADHHAFTEEDLSFGEGSIILLTEKDAVKCGSFYRGEAWVLPVEAHISSALADILLEKIHGHTSA